MMMRIIITIIILDIIIIRKKIIITIAMTITRITTINNGYTNTVTVI